MLNVYYANIRLLEQEQIFHIILESVNVQRREKVLRCKQEKDKKRSLLAGYLLRYALECEGLVYADLSFSVSEKGKPVLLDDKDLFFSLSHAGEYAVCAISDRNVGVDIETKSKSIFLESQKRQLEALAKRSFTQEEVEQFLLCKDEEKCAFFLQCWTRKESYSKLDGRGLEIGFNQIQTNTEGYWSKWLDEDTILSICLEEESFSDLQIKEITVL